MSIQQYKDKEIRKIIEQAFVQFHITDPIEKDLIMASIKQQMDTTQVLTNYVESDYASSQKYRNDIKTALIDIIAHLLHIRDMDIELTRTQARVKDFAQSTSNRLMKLENNFYKTGNVIRESFEEFLYYGEHNNTVVREGRLRVKRENAKIENYSVEDLQIVVHPAENINSKVEVTVSGTPSDIFNISSGSDFYHVNISAPREPSMYIASSFTVGAVLEITFKTSEPITPYMASVVADNPCKIKAVYCGNIEGEYSYNLGAGQAFNTSSFVERNTAETFTYFKIYVHFPEHLFEDNLFKYSFGLRSLKIEERGLLDLNGVFVSRPYKTKYPILGVQLQAKYSGSPVFKIKANEIEHNITAFDLDYTPGSITDPKSNEIFFSAELEQTDYFSGSEIYSFPLERAPLLKKGATNFTLYANDLPVEGLVDLTTFDSDEIVFTDVNQFYYKDKVLYTSFPLTDANYKVTYLYVCDSLSVQIELTDIDTVDEYYLKLITLEDFSYKLDEE